MERSKRAVVASALVAAAAIAGACRAFTDLEPPRADAGDVDVATPSSLPDVADAGSDLPGLVTLTEALQICSKVLTCPHVGPSIIASFGLPVDPSNFSQCVHTLSGPIDPKRLNVLTSERLRCVARSVACDVSACVVREEIDSNDPRIDPGCKDGGAAETCSGDTRVTCFEHNLGAWIAHCDDPVYAAGSHCVVTAGASRCELTVSGCPAIGPAQCVDGTEPLSVADFCFDAGGVTGHSKTDCRASGRACQAGVPGCAGAPCASHLLTKCDDATKLSVCIFDQVATLDCAPVGGRSACKAQDNAAYCSGPHDECTPYDTQPSGGQGVNGCDGTSIRLCIGGRITTVDCREAGAGFGCRNGTVPRSNYCGPPL